MLFDRLLGKKSQRRAATAMNQRVRRQRLNLVEQLEDRRMLSHYRGGSVSHDISAAGLIHLEVYHAWRSDALGSAQFSLFTGPDGTGTNKGNFTAGALTNVATGTEQGGAAFTVRNEDFTFNGSTLSAGTYYARWTSCCRVSGINNAPESSWALETKIVYQPGVETAGPTILPATVDVIAKGYEYRQNLDSIDPDGTPINYSFLLGSTSPTFGPTTDIPGISVDQLGNVVISAANTTSLANGRWVYKAEVTDGSGATAQRDVLLVAQTTSGGVNNNAPVLATIGPKTVAVGTPLTFTVSATDADAAQTLTLRSQLLPEGATFAPATGNPATRTFTWTPTAGQEGTYQVNFEAFDNAVTPIIDSELVTITVTGSNNPPVLAPVGNQTIGNGGTLSFTVAGSDPDAGQDVSYSAFFLPSGATFDPVTRVFSWTPTAAQYNNVYTGIKFRATDNGSPNLIDEESINITVGTGNVAPVIDGVANQTFYVGQHYHLNITANDSSAGQSITLSAVTIPSSASFATVTSTSPATSVLHWTPILADLGTNVLTFRAEDNGSPILSSQMSFTATVVDIGPLVVDHTHGDRLRLRKNGTNIEVIDEGDSTVIASRPLANTTGIEIEAAANADDTLIIDYSFGGFFDLPITFDGGAGGNDTLQVLGSVDATSAVYTPSGTTFGSGTVLINGSSVITFTGLEPVDISGFVNAMVVSPANAANALQLQAGFDSATGTIPAIVVTGNTGLPPTGIEAAHLFNNTNVLIDTSATVGAGANTITVSAPILLGHNNANLTLKTSAAGSVTVDSALALSGALSIDSPTVSLNAAVTAASLSGTATTTQVSAPGRIQQGVDVSAIGGIVNVAAGSYAETVILSKSLTLRGAQAGVDARGRIVGAPNPAVETIIAPVSGRPIELQDPADNATIDGFAVVGSLNGAVGVIESTTGATDGLQLLNNYVEVASGFTASALFLNKSAIDSDIDKNEFVADAGSTQAVFLDGPDLFHGLHFTNNNVLRSGALGGTGLFVDGNRNIGTSASLRTPLLQGNRFEGHALGLNAGQRSFANTQFVENLFTGNTGGFAGGPLNSGIAQNTFSNNTIYGLRLTAFGNTADPTRGAQNTVMEQNLFLNNGTTVDLTNGYGDIRIDDQFNGTQSTNTIVNNNLGSSTVGIFNRETNAELINVSGNWWGTNAESSVQAKVLGLAAANVDFTTYLHAGADISLAAGFQGDFSDVHVTALGAQSGAVGRIQEGINVVSNNGRVRIHAGTYSGGADAASGGKNVVLAPGNSPAQVIVSGDLILNGGDTLEFEFDGTNPVTDYDNFVVTGGVTLGGATLSLLQSPDSSYTPSLTDGFTLISNDAGDAVSGTFAGLAAGATVTINTVNLRLFYTGNDGNDVVLLPQIPTTAYVDDNWTGGGFVTGTFILDADLGTTGNQSAIFGYNAFNSVNTALSAVTTSGTVIVNGGVYSEAVDVNSTRSLEVTGPNTAQTVTFTSLQSIAGTTVVIEGASILIVGDGTNKTVAGTISGSGTLRKQGSGILTLSGANTGYTGAVQVNVGGLAIAHNDALGTVAGATSVAGDGAWVQLENTINVAAETITISGNGDNGVGQSFSGALQATGLAATWGGPVKINGSARVGARAGNTLTITGQISDTVAGPLLISGELATGKVVISNPTNNYTGQTQIVRGTLQIGADNALPVGTSLNVHSAGTSEVATFDLNNFNQTVGELTRADLMGGTPTGIVTNSGASNRTLTVNQSTTTTFNGVITGNLALTKAGAGSLTLSGTAANTYTGVTTLNAGTLLLGKTAGVSAVGGAVTIGDSSGTDTLRLLASDQIPDTAVVTINAGGSGNSGKFELNGFSETVAGISATNSFAVIQNAEAPGAPQATSTLTINNTANFDFAGIIRDKSSGSAAVVTLVKNGTGTQTFSGTNANSYSGTTTINAGTLQLGKSAGVTAVAGAITVGDSAGTDTLRLLASNQIADTSVMTINAGGSGNSGKFELNGFSETVGGISATNAAAVIQNAESPGAAMATSTLTVNNTADFAFAGIIRDKAGGAAAVLNLGKSGTGTLTLSGANAYTGTTTINGGTLLVNGSLAGTGAVAVNNTATLGGTGAIGGSTTVNSGGKMTGGTLGGVGTLTINNGLFFNGGTFAADFSGDTSDKLVVTGNVDMAAAGSGAFAINSQAGVASDSTVFTLIDKTSAGDITDPPLTGATEGSSTTVNTKTAYFTYAGGDGNNFTLSVAGNPAISGAGTLELRRVTSGLVDNVQLLQGGVIIDSRPLASIAGSYTVNASAGVDSLLVNYTSVAPASGFIPRNVVFNASGAADSLEVRGTDFTSITNAFTNSTDATLTLNPTAGGSQTINYTGLESSLIDPNSVGSLSFSLPATADAAIFEDDGGAIAGRSRLRSTSGPTFTTTEFKHATSNLSLTGGAGDSVQLAFTEALGAANVSVTGVSSIAAGFVSTIGNVTLSASGAITELGTDAAADITASQLNASAGAGIDVDTAIATLIASTTGVNADIQIDEADDISITSITTTGDNSDLRLYSATGNISQTGAILQTGLSSNANIRTLTADRSITLAHPGNQFQGEVTLQTSGANGNATIVDTLGALVLSINSIGGFLNALSTGGNIEQTLTTFVVGGGSRFETTQLNADILLATQPANNFGGPVALFTVGPTGDVFITDDNGLILTTSSIGGNLTATTGGLAGEDLTDTAGASIVVGGTSSFTAGAANVVLDSPLNDFNSAGVVSSNNTHIVDANSLALNLLNATTQVRLQAGAGGSGAITDNNGAALNIVAAEAALTAAGGIGSSANPLDTDIDRLAALNTVSGNIVIENINTPTLTIDTVAGLVGVKNLGALGSVDITTNGSLVVAANSEATVHVTLTTGETAAVTGENLTVNTGVTILASTGDILLEAGDDFNVPTGANLVAPAAGRIVTLQSIDGPAGVASTFNFTGNIDASHAYFRAAVGNSGEDTFNMAPDRVGSVLTPIDIFGDLPTVAPGDVLNLDINGLTIPTLMLGPGPNNGQWTFTPGQAAKVTYNSIETVNTVPALPYNLVLDMDFADYDDGSGDLIEVDLVNTQAQLRIRVNGAVAFLGNDNVINSLTILGSTDAETLRMLADTDNFLPTEGGGLTGALAMPPRKAASAAMTTSTRGPTVPSVYFNGNTGGVDQLEVVLGITRDVAHFSDAAAAANAGDVSVRPAAGGRVGMFMTFATLEDLQLTGAGGPLLVDATSTPNNSLLQIDNVGGAADGVSRVTGNNGFATTTFSNFTSLYVTGGAGDDTINLVAVDGGGTQPLTSVTLDGSSTFAGVPASPPTGGSRNDNGNDTIQVQSLPATVPVLLLGGIGNDIFRLHDTNNTVDNILSQVTVDGEDGNVVLASDNDQLFVIDSGDPSGETLDVTETTINGLTGYVGAGVDIAYSRIDRIDVTATGGADTINVDMDNVSSDLNTAAVRGSEGQDQFFLKGVENFVDGALPKFTDLFLYGDGPNDTTLGDNFGTTTERIRPSKTVVINIDGGVPSPVAPPGNIPGDRLNLTMAQGGTPLSLVEATAKTPVLVDTIGGTATSASHAMIKFGDIEWVDLVDLDGQTNVQRGDLYVRASEGADRIVLYPDTFLATRNTVRLRYNSTDIGPLNQTNTSVTSPGKFIAYGRGGNDQITINNTLVRDSELFGQIGNDYLVGSIKGGKDLLVGGSGADRMQGLADNDILWGDRRPDAPETPTDIGPDGIDQLSGGKGNDLLDAGGGNDRAYGEDGDDIVRGGDGNDTLGGDRGFDVVLGGAGNDKVNGGYDRDLLIGGMGIDTVDGDQQQDVVIGDKSKWDENTAANDAALVAFLLGTATPAPPEYWANQSSDYNARSGSSYLLGLLSANIEEDGSIDTLVGDLDFDWYFDVLTAKDKYSGKAATEKLN